MIITLLFIVSYKSNVVSIAFLCVQINKYICIICVYTNVHKIKFYTCKNEMIYIITIVVLD